MSFRFTNNLVGAMRYRLQLEVAHRALARRTFAGTCNGVEVTCSGYGTVLGIRLIDKDVWETYYRPSATATTPTEEGEGTTSAPRAAVGVDLTRLSTSIRAATWEAIQKIRAAKERAHHGALAQNTQLASDGELRHWYAEDATSMAPHFDCGLTCELGTPWMQAMRFGVAPKAAKADSETETKTGTRRGPVVALSTQDCEPQAIRIGSAHPLFTPALFQLESASTAAVDSSLNNCSHIDEAAVIREQKKEMARDERQFWERVELIRRGQLATIPGGVKRGYTHQDATIKSDVEDKVELRFTR